MNAIIRMAMLLAVSTGFATAVEPQVRVAASRELKVAIIDASKATAARETLHQAFATALGASLSRHYRAPVGVRVKCVGADHAAFNLAAGVYDAVLIVGRTLPDLLRRADAITLSAVPEQGRRDRGLILLIPNGDASLQGVLAAAFTGTVNDAKFLETLAGNDGRLIAADGDKVAAH